MYQTYHIYESCHHLLHIIILLVETNPKGLIGNHSTNKSNENKENKYKKKTLKYNLSIEKYNF